MSMDVLPTELLWRGALAVVPLAVVVAAICRYTPCRPSTRYTLWLVVLGVLVAFPFLPSLTLPQLPAGPPVVVAETPPTIPARHPDREVTAPTASLGPPATASLDESDSRDPGKEPGRPDLPFTGNTFAVPDPAGTVSDSQHAHRAVGALEPPAPHVPFWGPVQYGGMQGYVLAEPSGKGGLVAEPPVVAPPPPVSQEPPQREAAPAKDGSSAGQQWLAQLAVIRNAVMSLPPVPLSVWAGGLGFILLVAMIRISRSLRLIRSGRAAPPSVVRMVVGASRDLGLRRPPETIMVDDAVSPMLWCGRRVRLVLPGSLWAQLDDAGRRAVVCHELAHLKRRDHWVCWAEMIVGLIYWWHPVVWWIRRRLREEADLCCDAWVTALLPHGRRAYAQALLDTRRYSSLDPPAVPSVGLGATSLRARRFARRLTMVMTAHNSPNHSRRGVVLACTLAVGALVVTPILACPPSPKEPKAPKAERAPRPPKAPRSYTLVVPSAPPAPRAVPVPPTTFERFMRDRRPDRDDMSIEQRIEELERQLDRLYEQLERTLNNVRGLSFSGGVPMPGGLVVGGGPAFRQAGPSLVGPVADYRQALGVYGAALALSPGGATEGSGCLKSGANAPGNTVVRTYELSDGKLDALTELMLRSDVPIAVRPVEGGIEVHATPAQQCIFELFCTLIDGKDQVEEYRLSEGKIEALNKLMVRSDVPILVEPGCESIKVHGTDLEQAVFDAFVAMIHPGRTAQSERGDEALAFAHAQALTNLASQYESQARSFVAELQALRGQMRSFESQARAFERQAERARKQAERLHDKAEKYEDKAEKCEDEAEDVDGDERNSELARAQFRLKAEEFRSQAEALHHQAEALEDQADTLEDHAQQLEDEAEAVEDRIEDIEEEADEER